MNDYYNTSTGAADNGDVDARGPWNEGGDWNYVEEPAFQFGSGSPDDPAQKQPSNKSGKSASKRSKHGKR